MKIVPMERKGKKKGKSAKGFLDDGDIARKIH